MSLFKNILSVLIVSCLTTSLGACKKANSKSSQSEVLSFSTNVESLESSLNVRLNEFEKHFDSGQIAKLFDFTPPKVLNAILSGTNVSRAELDAQMDTLWEQTLQTVEINGFDLDKNANVIEFLENGRPYKILPTSTNMKIKANGSEIVSKSETLALIEKGEWYIVRLDEAGQVKMFRDAYPDFDSVDVMAPVMTMDGEEVTL